METASRAFAFAYSVWTPTLSQDLRLWIPIAHDDEWQHVEVLDINADGAAGTLTDDRATGNRMLHVELRPGVERTLTVRHKVKRRVRKIAVPKPTSYGAHETAGLERYLRPDVRVPLDESLAEAATGSQSDRSPVALARRLFDHLLHEFDYDSAGCTPARAAHLGDLGLACDLKRGTCTEFHGLFTGAARAMGIPTRWAFGFNVPAAGSGMIGGYHCWVEIFLPLAGWFPVDVTEAWKRKASSDSSFYFGGLDANRVQFTTGRDVSLAPPTKLGAIDRFIFPVVENVGEPIEVMPEFRFESLDEC